MLDISLGSPARRFLKRCDSQLYERLMDKIRGLAQNPFPTDVKRVEGEKEKTFRIRVGDYRIQYIVYYDKNELIITDVDKRPRAY